jgi:uncharacterized membrane protein
MELLIEIFESPTFKFLQAFMCGWIGVFWLGRVIKGEFGKAFVDALFIAFLALGYFL